MHTLNELKNAIGKIMQVDHVIVVRDIREKSFVSADTCMKRCLEDGMNGSFKRMALLSNCIHTMTSCFYVVSLLKHHRMVGG